MINIAPDIITEIQKGSAGYLHILSDETWTSLADGKRHLKGKIDGTLAYKKVPFTFEDHEIKIEEYQLDPTVQSPDNPTVTLTFVLFFNHPEIDPVIILKNAVVPTVMGVNLTFTQLKKYNELYIPANEGKLTEYLRGDKNWRNFAADVRASLLAGINFISGANITANDSVLTAFGKLQKQISNLGTASARNVPAQGNALPNEVVLGNDSRLVGAASGDFNAIGYTVAGTNIRRALAPGATLPQVIDFLGTLTQDIASYNLPMILPIEILFLFESSGDELVDFEGNILIVNS